MWKLRPPVVQDAALDVQVALAGTSHCVSHTSTGSASGDRGAAVLMSGSFMVTGRQAPAGWQLLAAGKDICEDVMSRFAIDVLDVPAASYVASPPASTVELSAIGGPVGVFFTYTPGPPFC